MKAKIYLIYLSILAMVSGFNPSAVFGQQSANTVDYQVTYETSTGIYSVWVVPNYNSNNANNPLQFEIGATAQVSLKVPTGFNISAITNVAGIWNSITPLKLGPAEQTQLSGQGLPAGTSYYVIGKGSSETNYGTFSSGTPVKLFTFTGNGCFGPIAILASTDNFVSVSDNVLSLNTAPSFYSRSGQPAGGNQQPLEQFRVPFGPSANCLAAINDAYTAQAAVPTNQPVLLNDQFNGVTPATSVQVRVTIDTNPPNGNVSVNADGSVTYTSNPGFAGIDTYTYTICDLANLTVCSTATVTVTVGCPAPAAPLFAVTQPSCAVATGTLTISSPAMGTGINYTVTGTSPPVAAVNQPSNTFANLATGSYTLTTTNASGCTSAPVNFTVNAQPATPSVPTVAVVAPTCTAAGTASIANYNSAMTYTFLPNVPGASIALNGDITGLAFGTAYTVTATSAAPNNCPSAPSSSFTIADQLVTPAVPTVAVVAPTCTAAGTASITNYSSAMTYTFTPNVPGASIASNGDITGLAFGTAYTVTATSAAPNNCPSAASASFTIADQLVTPAVPTVSSPLTYCRNAPAVALTATAPSGATLRWYTVPTNGVSSTTAPVPPTTTIGSTTYYVSSVGTSAGACESARVPLVVEILDCRVIYAYNDNNITPKNTPVAGQVLTNDDLNNGTGNLVVATTPIQQPASGSVVLNANGTYTYTPNPNFVGVDSFRYRVCDQGSPVVCDIATVYIKVYDAQDPINNNPPIALVDIYATPLNTPVNGSVLLNDKDPDVGQTLTATQLSNPSSGTVTNFLPNGTFTYTPNPGFIGTDTFTYTACDNGTPTECDDAVVQIEVKDSPILGQNMPPVAIDDYNTTALNTPVLGNVSVNDKDSEPNPTALTVNTVPISVPSNGAITLSPNGDYTYIPNNGFTGVDQMVYETCDAGNPAECARATLFIYVLDGRVALLPKAYLQGSLFGVTGSNLMRDDLRSDNLIPLASPYPALGFTALTTTADIAPNSVLNVTGDNAIVDWVFVELRNAVNNQQVEDSRSALIQRDGDIVEVDGVSPVTFSLVSPGSYYVVIKHRNHLGVMTQLPIVLSSTPATVDFTLPATPTFKRSASIVDQAQVVVDQGVALWAGNALLDGQVIYQGTSNDVNPIYQLVINSSLNVFDTPFFKVKTYNGGDINMNGETIFQGTGNDLEFIYQNVIKNHPGNSLRQNFFIIREQLP